MNKQDFVNIRSNPKAQTLFSSISLGAAALFLIAGVILILSGLSDGAKAAEEVYSQIKNAQEEAVYQEFYQQAYTSAEKEYHVKNRVEISVGNLREEQKLEVLKVSNVAYEITSQQNDSWIPDFLVGSTKAWYEIPGSGVFTVNLKAAEFIVDSDAQYILIRLPAPELSEFSTDKANTKLLHSDDGGLFTASNVKLGVDDAAAHIRHATEVMKQELLANQKFYMESRDSARTILSALVRQLNPGIPDLTVEIAFYGEEC